jgi:prophage tail gpP-like protein
MSFEVRLNGKPFVLWETAMAQRSIDKNCGVFRFTSSVSSPIQDFPMKVGDFIEILIDTIRKIVGFIDEMNDDEDPGSHSIIISGRDNIQDLIDSSVPDSAKITEGPISLKKLCERVINSLPTPPAIKVIEQVFGLADFTEDDLESAGSATSCMEYLVSFARKRQVYLVPDGDSNLLIYRPDKSNKAPGPLVNRIGGSTNNVKKSFVKRSQQNRFRKILCRSQDNFGFDPFADSDGEGTNRNATAEDSQIRATRYLEIQAEETMTDTECGERAAEEANIRRALGQPYTAIVAGHSPRGGTVWDFGQFVQIDDEVKGVKGEHLIKSVEWTEGLPPTGSKTRMVCVQSDAYQVVAEPTAATKRKSTTAPSLENAVPITQTQAVRIYHDALKTIP